MAFCKVQAAVGFTEEIQEQAAFMLFNRMKPYCNNLDVPDIEDINLKALRLSKRY